MTQTIIFLVEDDENIRELVLYALGSAGFSAQGFETGQEFFGALERQTPDLVLLDIMLPGEDGLALLSRLKNAPKTARLPVIMLTAKASEYDRVKGLDLGADDYISKPFGVMELISRVRALLRRVSPEKQTLPGLSVGNVLLDEQRRTVAIENTFVTLTFKEFELLAYLMRNEEIVLSREKIMEQVWGFDYEGESRTVDMHIKSLRQKLGACAGIIQTVRGVGYKASAQMAEGV